jgi:CheY-like chemotaxis protein
MKKTKSKEDAPDTVLVVEKEVLVRIALAEYLRHCGYRVFEASNADDAKLVLTEPTTKVDILFSAVEMPGSLDGFGLSVWARTNRPGLHIVLAGDVTKAAEKAGELCESGPHLKKPYEPEHVVESIKQLKAMAKIGHT